MLFGVPPQPEPEEATAPVSPHSDIPPLDADLDRILRDPVLQWRCKAFLDAGMNLAQARKLAVDNRVDIHFVVYTLIGRGCDPAVAFDIAAA